MPRTRSRAWGPVHALRTRGQLADHFGTEQVGVTFGGTCGPLARGHGSGFTPSLLRTPHKGGLVCH